MPILGSPSFIIGIGIVSRERHFLIASTCGGVSKYAKYSFAVGLICFLILPTIPTTLCPLFERATLFTSASPKKRRKQNSSVTITSLFFHPVKCITLVTAISLMCSG